MSTKPQWFVRWDDKYIIYFDDEGQICDTTFAGDFNNSNPGAKYLEISESYENKKINGVVSARFCLNQPKPNLIINQFNIKNIYNIPVHVEYNNETCIISKNRSNFFEENFVKARLVK